MHVKQSPISKFQFTEIRDDYYSRYVVGNVIGVIAKSTVNQLLNRNNVVWSNRKHRHVINTLHIYIHAALSRPRLYKVIIYTAYNLYIIFIALAVSYMAAVTPSIW